MYQQQVCWTPAVSLGRKTTRFALRKHYVWGLNHYVTAVTPATKAGRAQTVSWMKVPSILDRLTATTAGGRSLVFILILVCFPF